MPREDVMLNKTHSLENHRRLRLGAAGALLGPTMLFAAGILGLGVGTAHAATATTCGRISISLPTVTTGTNGESIFISGCGAPADAVVLIRVLEPINNQVLAAAWVKASSPSARVVCQQGPFGPRPPCTIVRTPGGRFSVTVTVPYGVCGIAPSHLGVDAQLSPFISSNEENVPYYWGPC